MRPTLKFRGCPLTREQVTGTANRHSGPSIPTAACRGMGARVRRDAPRLGPAARACRRHPRRPIG